MASSPLSDKMVFIGVKLPVEILDWLDVHLARLSYVYTRNGRRHRRPTRSGYIRELLIQKRSELTKDK